MGVLGHRDHRGEILQTIRRRNVRLCWNLLFGIAALHEKGCSSFHDPLVRAFFQKKWRLTMIRESRERQVLPPAEAGGKEKTDKRRDLGVSSWRQTRQQARAR